MYITVATTGRKNQDNLNIYYYVEDDPIQIDDPAVNELTPIASLRKTTYETEEEAIEAMDVEQIIDLHG